MKMPKRMQTEMEPFVKKELEQLENSLKAELKKTSTYSFWSLPLMIIAFVNLLFLFLTVPDGYLLMAVFYALIGATGVALSKEAGKWQKEVIENSAKYIVKRIKESKEAGTSMKKEYMLLIQQQPLKSIGYFVEFLEKENRAKRLSLYRGWDTKK